MSSVVRAVFSISAFTLLSRILGFVRDVLMTHAVGASWVNGVFNLAWMFPNLLRRLLGEGALSAAFIPRFTATLEREGKPQATALLASVSGALIVVLTALVLFVLAGTSVLPWSWLQLTAALDAEGKVLASAQERTTTLLQLTAILFPYVLPICLTAIFGGALNALGVFGLPAAAPVVLNVFWIAGIGGCLACGVREPKQIVFVLAWVLLVGGCAQVLPSLVQLARRQALARPRWPRTGDPARAVFWLMGPTVLGMSLTQISMLIDQSFAEWFCGAGSNTHVYLANRLLLFPHALTSLALATAVFPHFSAIASRDEKQHLAEAVRQAQQWTLWITVPASLGLVATAGELVDIAFVHGKFTAQDAWWTTRTTATLVAGLPCIGAAQLYARSLYAVGDMRTPARVAGWLLLCNLALNLVLVLGVGLGVAGLTIATSVSSLLNALLLRRRFHSLCPGATPSLVPLLRIAGAALAMLGVVLLAQVCLPAGSRWMRAVFQLGLPIALGIAAYMAVHQLLGGTEAGQIRDRIRARLTRSARTPGTPP